MHSHLFGRTAPLYSGAILMLLLGCLACCGTALAVIVASDDFDYPDGTLHGKTGGVGWTTAWNHDFGTEAVVGGALSTSGSGRVSRSFTAIEATGVVYVGVDMTYNGSFGGDWGGVTLNDFGTDKVLFGMPWSGGKFGISETGVADNQSGIDIIAGQSYRIVGAIDFGSTDLHLWIDPDGSDTAASADYTVTGYASPGSWINTVALDASGATTWDNLTVATSLGEVISAIPEPSSALLLGVVLLLKWKWQRRRLASY